MKNEFVPIMVLKSDRKKLKKWAVQRDMKMYQIINHLINTPLN